MKRELKILMIDDHPMIIEGYKKVLSSHTKNKLHIVIAKTCDQAYKTIRKAIHKQPFDVVFIDIQLPPSSDGKITSGEDLAFIVKKELPAAKIIILTMIENPYRLKNLIETVPHHGLLIKSDITKNILLKAFDTILNNTVFYSKTVKKFRDKTSFNKEFLDDYDKKILYHLSNGVLTKNLPNYIRLSLSSIEKRKNHIRQVFNVEKADDEQLLIQAKKRGFI